MTSNGEKKRIRFEKISERLQRVKVDILHKVRQEGALNVQRSQPETGELGCLFLDELVECERLDRSQSFRSFYRQINDYVQSLPELIHHKDRVVHIIVTAMQSVEAQDLPSLFRLIAVLARDLNEELRDNFHKLMSVLLSIIPKVAYTGKEKASNPELTAQLFECISHLLRCEPFILNTHWRLFSINVLTDYACW